MKYRVILSHGAIMPTRNKKNDSGIDLRAVGYTRILNGKILDTVWFEDSENKSVTIIQGERILINTGIKIAQPEHDNSSKVLDIQVRPRSGLALKYGITVLNTPGTVDNGYRNEIGVILLNTDLSYEFDINNGDRVAQMIISESIIDSEFEEVKTFDDETDRGETGFGDSGVK